MSLKVGEEKSGLLPDSINRTRYNSLESESGSHLTGKDIFVFCDEARKDGKPGPHDKTNVWRLYQLILSQQANDHVEQGSFYSSILRQTEIMYLPGFGSGSSKTLSRMPARLFNSVTVENILKAYLHIAKHYEAGSKVYLFGYSKGAFVARKVASLIYRIGIIREREVVLKLWDRHERPMPWSLIESPPRGADIRIQALVVWDTINESRPSYQKGAMRAEIVGMPDEELPSNVNHVFHALAFHENRKLFRPTLFRPHSGDEHKLKEVWFPGTHTDVGMEDVNRGGLSNISLIWAIDELQATCSLPISCGDLEYPTNIEGLTPSDAYHDSPRLKRLVDKCETRLALMNKNSSVHETVLYVENSMPGRLNARSKRRSSMLTVNDLRSIGWDAKVGLVACNAFERVRDENVTAEQKLQETTTQYKSRAFALHMPLSRHSSVSSINQINTPDVSERTPRSRQLSIAGSESEDIVGVRESFSEFENSPHPAPQVPTRPPGLMIEQEVSSLVPLLPTNIQIYPHSFLHSPRTEKINNAANSFLRTGDLEAASQAITELQSILNKGSKSPLAERAQTAEVLSTVLSQRFKHYGDIDDMEHAVEIQMELLSLCLEDSVGSAFLAKSYSGLGHTLTNQFEHTGNPIDAELSSTHLTKALEIMSPGDSDRQAVLIDFARIDMAYYARSDDPSRLQKALTRYEEVFSVLPVEAPERISLSELLGNALLSQFERTHSTGDIARAVECLEFTVDHTPAGSPEKPKRMRSYGDAVFARAVLQNDLNSLNAAIDIYDEAVQLLTPEHAAYPTVIGSRAKAFHARYQNTNNEKDLDLAIEDLKISAEFSSFTDPQYAGITELLGILFKEKYLATTRLSANYFLDSAIALLQQAVAMTPADHPRLSHRRELLEECHYLRPSPDTSQEPTELDASILRSHTNTAPAESVMGQESSANSPATHIPTGSSGRFSLFDDEEEEIATILIPGDFPFALPNPIAPPSTQDAPSEPTPDPSSSSSGQNTPPIPRFAHSSGMLGYSFLDEEEEEVAATPIPGDFPFAIPSPIAPPPTQGAPSEPTPAPSSSSSGQNTPPIPPGSPKILVTSPPENSSDDQAIEPDPEDRVPVDTPEDSSRSNSRGGTEEAKTGHSHPRPASLDATPNPEPIIPNESSSTSSPDVSVATTPTAEEPVHPLGVIDNVSASQSASETNTRVETSAISNSDAAGVTFNARPPIRITTSSSIEPIDGGEEDVVTYIPPQDAEMPSEERGNFAANAFMETGSLEAASQAITEFNNILNAGSEVPVAERARVAEVLSTVLSQRFEHYGHVDDMEQAIETQMQLASFSLEDDTNPELKAKSHSGLGRTLTAQFEHTGDPDDAELAINHLNQALEMMPPGHPGRPAVLADFAKAELAQYAHSDDPARLQQALARCEEALSSVPAEAPERTPLSGLIGGALLARFERTYTAEDIALAVEYLEFAVNHTSEGNPERPKRMRSYGDAVLAHAVLRNDLNSLNAAIDIHEAAIQLLTPEHAAYPALMGSLAKAFHTRYRSTNNMEDLDKAIDNFKTSVEYTPFTDPNHARITDLLGRSFMAKYRSTTQPPRSHFLDYAVTLHRQAVALTPPEHRHYAGRLESLGKAYSKRYRAALRRQRAQQSDLQEAERCLQEAMNRDPSRAENVLQELAKLNQL